MEKLTSTLVLKEIVNMIDFDGLGYDEKENIKPGFESVQFAKKICDDQFKNYPTGYFKTYQDFLADHLGGLPSWSIVPYTNFEIIQLAKNWGSIPQNATEQQEDKITNNFFNFIAAKLITIFSKKENSIIYK